MKKIVIISLASSLPFSMGLGNINLGLQSTALISSHWINELTFNNKNVNYANKELSLYQDNKINIDLIENQSNQTIAQIYAKKPQKNYYLSLKNNNFYRQKELATYIKNKFYHDKVIERFISNDKFFTLFDTAKDEESSEGKIDNNANLGFRSSWGKTNSAEANGKFRFNLYESTLKNHIVLHEVQERKQFNWLTLQDIEILTIRPTRMGILPLVQIHQLPIGNAFWTTNNIIFNNYNFSQKFDVDWQKLILPEGAGAGQEWWKWFLSAGSIIIGVGFLALGVWMGNSYSIALGIASIVSSIIMETLNITAWPSDGFLFPQKILTGIEGANKIYNMIMDKSLCINNMPEIHWDILSYSNFQTQVQGRLRGEAWSTAIFGQYSQMSLHTIWGAMNADIKYWVYRNK